MKRIRESEYFRMDIITTLLCLLPILLGVAFYSQLPEQVAIHFNAANQPDGYASRAVAVFGVPALLMAVQLFVCIVMELDPKRKNTPRSMQTLGRVVLPVISLFVQCVVILFGLNKEMDLSMLVNLLLGFLFLIIGNLLPKCKHNYTVGIKLPTTLGSEENWNKTHRLGGFVWVIGSLFIIAFSFVKLYAYSWIIIAAMVLIPTVYSCVYAWRGKTE